MAPPLPVSSLIVEDWFNGFYASLMLATVWIVVSNKKSSIKDKLIHLAMIGGPWACSTLHSSLNWVYYAAAINDNELPGGPGLLYSLTHVPLWIEGVGDTFFCLNILMADCLFIWRCWTIWGRRWLIVVLPILATLAGTALAVVVVYDLVIAASSKEAFTVAKKTAEFITFSTAYFSLSIATSLTTTLLIILRIILVQRASREVGLPSNEFNPIIEIVVESAALYSLSLLIFVVLDVTKNSNVYYAQNIHAQMAGLAPLLIVLRVAAGYSRARNEWSTSVGGPSIKFGTASSSTAVRERSATTKSDPEDSWRRHEP